MHRLLYSSTATTSLDESELEILLGTSRRNNEAAGLTGILLHIHAEGTGPAFFVQALEGPRDAVEQTYRRIERDELHADLTLLQDAPAERRRFGGWRMRLENLSVAQLQMSGAEGPSRSAALRPEQLVRDPVAMEDLVFRYA